MPAKQRKKFLGRWHPTGIAWWDDSRVAVARASGGVTILDSGDFAHNVLGPSAEFFAPGIKMAKNERPSTEHNGFFLLEVSAPVKEGVSDESVLGEEEEDEDDDDEGGEAGILSRLISILTWRGRKQKQAGSYSWTQELRLLYFQSTSPDDLYRKKIDDAEYGEAVMLARHYGLDCDPVYERQWRLSDHGNHAVADYLSKISDVSVVVAECSTVIPETAEAMEGLLKFGIRTVGDADPASREKFQIYLKRLAIYQEVVDARNADSPRSADESHFEAVEFSMFRDVPLLDSAKSYASETVPDVAAVSAMMHSRDAAAEMAAHALSIIAGYSVLY